MSVVKGFVVKESVKINEFENRSVAHARVSVTEGCSRYDKEKKEYVAIEGRSPLYLSVEYWGDSESVHKAFDNLQNSKDLIEFTGALCMKSYVRNDGTEASTPLLVATNVAVVPKKANAQ